MEISVFFVFVDDIYIRFWIYLFEIGICFRFGTGVDSWWWPVTWKFSCAQILRFGFGSQHSKPPQNNIFEQIDVPMLYTATVIHISIVILFLSMEKIDHFSLSNYIVGLSVFETFFSLGHRPHFVVAAILKIILLYIFFLNYSFCFLHLFVESLTAWIIAFTITLFTWFATRCRRCQLFRFVFGDDNGNRIQCHFTRLSRRTIDVCQSGWVFFVLCFGTWRFRWLWITVAIWYSRCSRQCGRLLCNQCWI